MMHRAIGIAIFGMLVALTACKPTAYCDVTVGLLGDEPDSVALYLLDDNYDALRLLAADSIAPGGSLHYRGVFSHPQLAVLRLASDSVPYLFTLDDVPTLLQVGIRDRHRSMRVARGSDDNHAIVRQFIEIERLCAEVDTVRARYNREVADSAFNARREAELLSSLHRADSLRTAAIMRYVGCDRPVSYIFWRRFGYLLPADSVPEKYRK